jgi:hypothetical protein
LEPAPWVGGRVVRDGLPDDANFPPFALVDDGTTGGDAKAKDGVFTNSITTCCAEVGLRVVRLQAERLTTDGVQQAMAVDLSPFAVVTDRSQAPAPATPAPPPVAAPGTTTPPPPTVPPTGAPPAPTPPTAVPGQGVPGPGGGAAGASPSPPTPGAPAAPTTTAPPANPAQATIAAQATLIAQLQTQLPNTPTPTP